VSVNVPLLSRQQRPSPTFVRRRSARRRA
jgi:hypothetical protein